MSAESIASWTIHVSDVITFGKPEVAGWDPLSAIIFTKFQTLVDTFLLINSKKPGPFFDKIWRSLKTGLFSQKLSVLRGNCNKDYNSEYFPKNGKSIFLKQKIIRSHRSVEISQYKGKLLNFFFSFLGPFFLTILVSPEPRNKIIAKRDLLGNIVLEFSHWGNSFEIPKSCNSLFSKNTQMNCFIHVSIEILLVKGYSIEHFLVLSLVSESW